MGFWRHPSQEQIYFSVLSLPHHSPGHHWDLSGRSRVHLHCSIPPAGCLSGPGPSVGRRKKTGSRRRIVLTEDLVAEDPPRLGELQYWAPASSCLHCSLVLPLSPHWTGMVGRLLLDPLIHQPPEPAVHLTFPGRGPKTGSRRRIDLTEDLAAEDPEEAGELQSWALPRLLVKSVLLSPTKTPFTRSDLNTGRRRHKDGSAWRFLVDPAL